MPLEFFLMDNPLQCEKKNKEQYEFPLFFFRFQLPGYGSSLLSEQLFPKKKTKQNMLLMATCFFFFSKIICLTNNSCNPEHKLEQKLFQRR